CEAVKNAVQNWQYPYLKLDFLYAAALQGKRYDPTQTRAQILRRGMEALRKAAGESVFLVGCGLPLGAGIGLVDAMRISSDVSNTWDPTYFGIKTFFRSEPFMPSARNAIQNVLTRMPMHRRWWVNDPDCLILRQPSGLNDDEVRSLATVIALSGGSMILSDDMAAVGLERMRIAENLLPVIGERGRVIDWFDQGMPEKIRLDLNGAAGKWSLLARFNWSNKKEKISITAQDFEMTSGDYRVRSFWSGLSQQVSSGEDLWNEIVPPHGCVLLAVRKSLPQQTCYLGSDLHISQGKEVIDWQETPGFLSIKINAKINGLVDLVLPRKPQKIDVAGGGELVWYEIANSCYRLQLDSAISDRSINIRF
ncbi:MAG: hypothetical protein LWX83_15185, partial [Anaerolineae bacterium]|nr:hypothetical protein [Anaerolineae bacterium]